MNLDLDISIGSKVVSANSSLSNITHHKLYKVIDAGFTYISIVDDKGVLVKYDESDFIEADIYFCMSFYMTMLKVIDLTTKY